MSLAGLRAACAFGAILLAAIVTVRRRYAVVVVDGSSMEPTLAAGDRLMVRRTSLAELRAGQVVVVQDPHPGAPPSSWLVKRVAAAPGDPVPAKVSAALPVPDRVVPAGRVVVLGDNSDRSVDSRHFGYADGTHVLGVALRTLRRREEVSHQTLPVRANIL